MVASLDCWDDVTLELVPQLVQLVAGILLSDVVVGDVTNMGTCDRRLVQHQGRLVRQQCRLPG